MAGADAEGAQWVKRQATGAEATADERVELVLLLDTTPAALVLEARRCGLELARIIRDDNPTLPLLLQSAEPSSLLQHVACTASTKV